MDSLVDEIEKKADALQTTLVTIKELATDYKLVQSTITKKLIGSAIKKYALNANLKLDTQKLVDDVDVKTAQQ